MAEPLARAYVELTAKDLGFSKAIGDAVGQVARFGAALYGVTLGIREVVKAASDYQESLALLQVELDVSREASERLLQATDSLREVWGYTRVEATKALAAIEDAGYNVADSMRILNEGMKVARATGSDLGEAVNSLASLLAGLDLGAKDAARAANVLFTIMAEGRVNLKDLDLGFARLILTGKSIGVTLEDLGAWYTALSKRTTETYNIYLALNGIMKSLISPGARLRETIRDLGYSTGVAMVQSLGFSKTLQTLIGLVEAGRLRWTDLVTDVRALSGVMGALPLAMEDALDILRQLTSEASRLDEAANVMMGTWQRQVARFRAVLEGFLAEVGAPLLALLTDVLEALLAILKPLTEVAKAISWLLGKVLVTIQVGAQNTVTWADLLNLALPAFIAQAVLTRSPLTIPLALMLLVSTSYRLTQPRGASWPEVLLGGLFQAGGWALAGATIGAAAGPVGAAVGAAAGFLASIAVTLIVRIVDVLTEPPGPTVTEQILGRIKDIYGDTQAGLEQAIKPFSVEFDTRFKPSLTIQFSELEQSVKTAAEFIRDEAQRTDELIRSSSSKTAQDIAIAWAQAGAELGEFLSEIGMSSVEMAKAAAVTMFGGLGEYLADLPHVFWKSFLEAGSLSIEEIKRQAEELGALFARGAPEFMLGGIDIGKLGAAGQEIASLVNEMFYEITESVPKGFSELLARLWDALRNTENSFINFTSLIDALIEQVSDSPFQFAALINNIKKFADEVNKVSNAYREAGREVPESLRGLNDALNKLVSGLGRVNTTVLSLSGAVDSLARKMRESRMPLDEIYRSFVAAGSSVGDLIIALRGALGELSAEPAAFAAFVDELTQATEWIGKTIEIYKALGLAAPESLVNFQAALSTVVGDVSRLGDSARRATDELNELSRYAYLLAEIEDKRKAMLEAQMKVGLKEQQIADIQASLPGLLERIKEYEQSISEMRRFYTALFTEAMRNLEVLRTLDPILTSARERIEMLEKSLESVQSVYRIQVEEVLPRLQAELGGLIKAAREAEEAYSTATLELKKFTIEVASKVVSTIGDIAGIPASVQAAILEVLQYQAGKTSVLNMGLAIVQAAVDVIKSGMEAGAEMIRNGASEFVERLRWAADQILQIILGLLTASEPYRKLSEVLSTIFNYLLNILFGFLWPVVAILEELGFKIGVISREVSETTEEFRKVRKTLSELNVPAGFKALAMRLEYLVARPGEPYVPEEETIGGGGAQLPQPRIEVPEWARRLIETFKPVIEELAGLIKSIATHLQAFAEAIGPSFTSLLLAILMTLFTALNSLAAFLATNISPILVEIFNKLYQLWVSVLDPFIQSAVVPTLQRWIEAIAVFIRDNLIPFLEKNVLPTLMNLWPKIEGFVLRIIQMGEELLQFLDENWDKIESLIEQWLNQGLVNIGKMFDMWKVDTLLKSGDLFGALREVWESKNLTFWEKILATLGVFLRPFEEGQILLGLFNIALGVIVAGLSILKVILEAFLSLAKLLWNALAGFLNSIFRFIEWLLSKIGIRVSLPDIPQLQEGGLVLDKTLAVLGEAGKEVVMPLEQFMNIIGGTEMAPRHVPELVLVNEIHLEVDGREVAYAVRRHEVKENIVRGKW